ncbi:MAG TPA: hypothetical protein VK097_08945 [Lentibacillus sp.]|uniref:hypothetical protein n=1 Tax=Lentibacillus sp. TaxID=1925746 RepID=UPI002B4B5C08|nr:hypothetical protein [Lentibacillus sp.]HLR62554.1 hypothetical protein [Lentibacillus sp.]
MRKLQSAVPVLLCISILVGCSMQSEEEAIKDTEKTAEETFYAENAFKTNEQLDSFSMYVPAGMEVVEEDSSNVIIEEGDQTYIVFYNNLENPLSKLSYESAAAKSDQALLLESFKDREKFGYIRVLPDKEEDNYELQTGVGGVKVTTYTSKSELDNDAEDMMKMAHSIVVENQSTAQK